jgi:glucan biosynthesis protein C
MRSVKERPGDVASPANEISDVRITQVSPKPPGARLHLDYMDAARSILILLGVVLHASNVYAEDGAWLVNATGSRFCALLGDFLHLFRMPAFFIISGFFCAYTLPKYTPMRFLRVRMTRLVVPFLAAALILNGAQILVSQHIAMEGVRPLANPLPLSFWFSSGWVYHLWFLLNLIVYFLLVFAVVATPAAKRLLDRIAAWIEPRLRPNLVTWLALVVLPACAIEALQVLGWLVPALHNQVLWFDPPITLLYYAVFFVTGMLLCRFRVLLDLFMRANIALVALSTVVVFTYVLIDPGHSLVAKTAAGFAHALLVMLLCQCVLLLFKLLANRPSRAFHYLADASYSIYLFHHIVVVLVGIALLALSLAPVVEFLIVTAVAVAVSLAIHHFAVLRVPLLRFLFNGKYEAARPANAPASGLVPARTGARHAAEALARVPG